MTFVVRHGNPKGIKNWDDLVKPGMQMALANPKTSGNGRYACLSADGYALKAAGGDEAVALELIDLGELVQAPRGAQPVVTMNCRHVDVGYALPLDNAGFGRFASPAEICSNWSGRYFLETYEARCDL